MLKKFIIGLCIVLALSSCKECKTKLNVEMAKDSFDKCVAVLGEEVNFARIRQCQQSATKIATSEECVDK